MHDGSCILGAPVPFCAVSFPVFIASRSKRYSGWGQIEKEAIVISMHNSLSGVNCIVFHVIHTLMFSQTRFENYFGGPYLELGQLLHHKLFGSLLPVDEEMFVSSVAVLERLSAKQGEHHEAEKFYFSVFSEGKEAIDRQCELLRSAVEEVLQ